MIAIKNRVFEKDQKDAAIEIVQKLVEEGRLDLANSLITRPMTKDQAVAYAMYATDQLIGLYERDFPNTDRLKKAVEGARVILETSGNINVVASAWASYVTRETVIFWGKIEEVKIKTRIINHGIDLIKNGGI